MKLVYNWLCVKLNKYRYTYMNIDIKQKSIHVNIKDSTIKNM